MRKLSTVMAFRRSCSRLDSAQPLLSGCPHHRTGRRTSGRLRPKLPRL